MGIVVSMLLVAAGAIMRYAVTVQGHGFNVHTTGVILMVVGAIGAVLSIGYWASWGGFGGLGRRRGDVVSGGTTMTSQRTTVQEKRVS